MSSERKYPKGWEIAPLKKVVKCFLNGGTPSTEITRYWTGNIPWVTGADFEDQKVIVGRRYITEEAVACCATNIVPKGHILSVTRTGVGKIAQAPVDIAISQDITGLVVNETLYDPKFIYWQLNRLSHKLSRLRQGTSIKGILREDFEEFVIPAPSYKDQQKITEILNGVDRAIESTKAVIEQTRSTKMALMQSLFTKGCSEFKGAFKKDRHIGLIPARWTVSHLTQIAADGKGTFTNGPFGSDLLKADFVEFGVPVIYIQDIRDGRFKRITENYVEPDKAAQLSFCNVKAGDVLLTKVGDPPCVASVYPSGEPEAVITQDVIRLRVNRKKANPEFVAAYLNSEAGRKEVRRILITGTRDRVSLGDFKTIRIVLPDIKEQGMIARLIWSIEERENVSVQHEAQLSFIKTALSQVLLTGKVPVKV